MIARVSVQTKDRMSVGVLDEEDVDDDLSYHLLILSESLVTNIDISGNMFQ